MRPPELALWILLYYAMVAIAVAACFVPIEAACAREDRCRARFELVALAGLLWPLFLMVGAYFLLEECLQRRGDKP